MTTEERKFAFLTQDPMRCLESPMERVVYNVFKSVGIVPTLQYPVAKYWIDFAFPEHKVAIEYDGEIHLQKKEQDDKRDKFLEKEGWKTIRLNKFHLESPYYPEYYEGERYTRLELFALGIRKDLKAKRLVTSETFLNALYDKFEVLAGEENES